MFRPTSFIRKSGTARLLLAAWIASGAPLVAADTAFIDAGDADALPLGGGPLATVGVIVGSNTSTISDAQGFGYGKPNQSRLWFNSDRQRWDALVPADTGGDSASDHFIVKDVVGSQEFTAVKLEDRNTGRPDAFWLDGTRELYVLGSHGTLTRIWKLDYVGATDSYEIDVDVNGIEVPGLVHGPSPGENRPASIYVTPNGRLWTSVMRAGALEVQISDDGGRTWLPTPVLLDPGVRIGVTSWSHFTLDGKTYASLFAAENGEAGVVQTLYYYWFVDQDADAANPGNWVDESASLPGPVGIETSDDHVRSARDLRGNQYFVVKTEFGLPTDPRIRLFKRTPVGGWTSYTVTRAEEVPEQTRPSIVVDAQTNKLFIYTTATGGGDGVRVHAPLDALDQLVTDPRLTVFSEPGKEFDDISAPRHPVTTETGVVVLAHNETDKTVWFAVESVAEDFCLSASGGTPMSMDLAIPQTDVGGLLEARLWRPDPALQIAPCPVVSLVPRASGFVTDVSWAAERLARDGYVVIVVDPALNTFESNDRAVRSGIDFLVSPSNPWSNATDTSRVGAAAGPYGASALTLSQLVDPRIDAIVAWDNLAFNEKGDRGSPNCFVFPGPGRQPKVPAMGQASDRCFKFREAKKSGYDWWRSNGVEAMQVVFGASNPDWWGPTSGQQRQDWSHYYTVGWFDRWLKDDPTSTERLVAREVLGKSLTSLLDWWYRSAVFLDGYDCSNFRSSCSAPE